MATTYDEMEVIYDGTTEDIEQDVFGGLEEDVKAMVIALRIVFDKMETEVNQYGIVDYGRRLFLEKMAPYYKFITAFVYMTGWRQWKHAHAGNAPLSMAYTYLYQMSNEYAYSHLKGAELDYFFRETD